MMPFSLRPGTVRRPALAAAGAVVIFFALAMLLPNLIDYSMRNDEVVFVRTAIAFDISHGYPNEFLGSNSVLDNKPLFWPPLYFSLLNLWMRAAGQTDFALRVMTLLTTLLTAAFVFRIGVDLTGEVFTGAAAALLFSSMGYVIYYTHQASPYSLLMLTSMATLFFFIRWWRSGRLRYAVGIVLSATALLYGHYYGAYVIGALNLYALIAGWRRRGVLLRWILLQIAVVILYLPWLPIIALDAAHGSGGDPINFPTSLETVERTVQILLSELTWLYALLIGIGAVAALRSPAWKPDRRWLKTVGLLLAFLLGSLTLALLVNLKLLTFVDRRVIYLVPAFVLLLAFLLTAAPRRAGYALAAAAVLVGFAAGWSPRLMGNWFYRQGVEALAARLGPGDVAYLQFHPPFDEHIIRYYADRLLPEGAISYTVPELDVRNPFLLDQLMDDVWLKDDFWVMRPAEDDVPWAENIPGGRFTLAETIPAYWFALDRFEVVYDDRQPTRDAATLPDRIDTPLIFGDMFALTEYEVDAVIVRPGGALTVRPDWEAIAPPDEDYAVYVHLLADDGQTVIASGDSDPHHLGRIVPTTRWPVGHPIHDEYTLTIDPAAPPGEYTLRIGFYSRMRPLRLPVTLPDGTVADGVPLARIRVTAE